jgi:hypothetical protein
VTLVTSTSLEQDTATAQTAAANKKNLFITVVIC